MLPVLRIITPIDTKQQKKSQIFICITLRQWAILFSILIFIITAIITTCTVLGTLHTKQLLQLLEDDIEEEHEKHRFEDDEETNASINSNEALLRHSQEVVLTFSKILSICMWLAWLNLVLAAVLIYGVTTMTSIYIVPWILLSGTTYLLAITTVVMGYLNLIPGLNISYTMLLICLAASLILIQMWYTIVLYYISLGRGRCARYTSFSPTVIHAYGGYTHTIQPINNGPSKSIV